MCRNAVTDAEALGESGDLIWGQRRSEVRVLQMLVWA
jgi:hypothetical protein